MRRIITGLALYTLSFAALAVNNDLALQVAVELLESNQPQDAYELLTAGHDERSTNPQEWFLLGASAKASGQFKQAISYFEKVIELAPNSHRAKLELATLLYQSGDKKRTKQLLLDVKAARPVTEVANNIDRFLATIETTGKQKNWRVRGSVGITHDSNANAGPDEDFINMFGFPFALSDDAKNNDDEAVLLNIAFDHVLPISQGLNWQSNVSLGSTNYKKLDNLDQLSLSLSSGPTWLQNNATIWSVPITANQVKVGHKQAYYSYSAGIAPQVRYSLSKSLSLSLATSYQNKRYHSFSKRNSSSRSLSPSVSWQLSKQTNLRAGASVANENSGLDTFSNDLWSLSLGGFHSFNNKWSLSANASYADTNYEEKEAAYNDNRHDKNSRLAIDVIYNFSQIDSDLVLSASMLENRSNLKIYNYDRDQLSFSIRKAL